MTLYAFYVFFVMWFISNVRNIRNVVMVGSFWVGLDENQCDVLRDGMEVWTSRDALRT